MPPISSWNFAPREAQAMATLPPVSTEPVKEIAFTSRESSSVCPTTEPRPMTRLNTPFGRPEREMISAKAQAEPGTRSAGLNTTALPKASAGAIFQAGMAMGKFHGQMRPTTPSASRVIVTSTPGRTDAMATPSTRSASCAKNLKICAARIVSAMPLARGFPSSRDRSAPISSFRARSSLPMNSRTSAFTCGVVAAQAGCAALAAAMAVSVCTLSAWAYSPTMSVMSEGLMFSRTPFPSSHSPLMKFRCNAMMPNSHKFSGGTIRRPVN